MSKELERVKETQLRLKEIAIEWHDAYNEHLAAVRQAEEKGHYENKQKSS